MGVGFNPVSMSRVRRKKQSAVTGGGSRPEVVGREPGSGAIDRRGSWSQDAAGLWKIAVSMNRDPSEGGP